MNKTDKKKLDSLGKKYDTENSKKEGFSTTSNRDLQKEREKIKSGFKVKAIGLLFASLAIITIWKALTGDYEKKTAGATVAPIVDSIDVGSGTPSIELIKDDINQLRKSQDRLKVEYQKKMAKAAAEQDKVVAKLAKELEEAKKAAAEKPAPVVDDNKSSERVAELRNEIYSQLAEFKDSLLHGSSKKETLPKYDSSKDTSTSLKKEDLLAKGQKKKRKIKAEEYTIQTISVEPPEKSAKEKNATKEFGFSIITGLSKALLITGVQAPTFGSGVKNPKPVLVSFNSDILLPNDKKINIKECTGLGTAVGNMNTRRAEITITKLNCILEKEGRTYKVEQKVEAYLIDGKDGAYGLKGRLVDSGARIVMRQLQVGFLQGVTQAFQTALQPPVQQTATTSGILTAPVLPSFGASSQYGAVSGGVSGLNALADYYKQMMDGLYPTISVRAGREVGVFWRGGETITLKGTRLFSVTGRINDEDRNQPFATESSEELEYETW